jgi:integrase
VSEERLYLRGRIWWAWGYWSNGERWHVSTRCRDKTAAARFATRVDRERSSVDRAEVAELSVEQALRDVIAAKERERKSPLTVKNYRRCGGHLVRLLGTGPSGAPRDIHTLTLAALESYIDRRTAEGGHGPKTMRSTIAIELGILGSALRYAKRHGRYRGDVESIWPKEALSGAHVPHERYLTREEYEKLHGALAFNDRPDYLVAYVFCGARRSEVWRITPGDVDLVAGTLRIRGTKTKRSDRVVPIAADLRPVLERRLAETPAGSPLFPRWEEHSVLQRACKRAGIPMVSANDLRRTFCSWLAQQGVPLLVTVRLMGHSSVQMVTRVYAQFGADDLRAAIDRLPTIVTPPVTPEAAQGSAGAERADGKPRVSRTSSRKTTERTLRSDFFQKSGTGRKRRQNKGKKR